MLKNFILDADLKKYYPKLSSQLWSTQSDYSTQISQAYDILQNDLWNRSINPREVMIPLDLKKSGTTANQPLTSTTETTATTGAGFLAFHQRRLVVKASAISGSWTIKIQGTNISETPASDDSSWEDVSGATVTITTTAQATATWSDNYKWYRYVSTGGTSCTYTVALYETIFDNALIYGSFILIFSDFRKEQNDIWDLRMIEAKEKYESSLNAIKFYLDSNSNGIIETGDEVVKANVRFTR